MQCGKQNLTSFTGWPQVNFTGFLLFAFKNSYIIPTTFTGKHVKFFEIRLDAVV